MKKAFCCLLILSLPLLGGCSSRASYPRLEQFRVIQTLGVDALRTGLRLSLATGAGERGAADARCLSADGLTLSAALKRAESLSTEETLFCGHVRQLVVGEDVALEPLLETVGRSADLRLDMPLYLLRGATAETLLTEAGGESRGVTEILDAVRAELDYGGDSRDFTAGRVLRDLRRGGCALLCAIRYTDAAERPGSGEQGRAEGADTPKTAVLSGFALVQDGKVRAWLKPEALLGIGLLRNSLGVQTLTLTDMNGAEAALEVSGGSCRIRPLWRDDGTLQGLDITARVRASLLEAEGSPLSNAYIDDLTARLEAAISEQLRELLTQAKTLKADCLGLAAAVENASPLAFRRLEEPFASLLPKLEISLTVQSAIGHEYDME